MSYSLRFFPLLFNNETPYTRLCFIVVSQFVTSHSSLSHCCLTLRFRALVFVSLLFSNEILYTRLYYIVVYKFDM